MKVKIKKLHSHGIGRVEGEGDIREVMIHSDLFDKDRGRISICFMGHRSSGIVELTEKEAVELYDTLGSKINLVRNIKIIKG